jgi:hypothetical protein
MPFSVVEKKKNEVFAGLGKQVRFDEFVLRLIVYKIPRNAKSVVEKERSISFLGRRWFKYQTHK